jgi:tetratricopeptide (TPR) repeat protein
LDRALEIDSENPVFHGDRLHLLIQEDRHQDALTLAEELAERFPERAPIHHYHGWLLYQLNREEEALEVFAGQAHHFESPRLTLAWAAAAFDVNRTDHALQAYESLLERFPNVVPQWKYAAHYKLARTHQRLGNQQQALDHARQTGQHAEELVQSLQKGQTPWQQLNVPFQLQSFVTCAPASAAAILNYFGAEVDQSEIASQITYNGTHDYDLKKWLEQAGFVVRPFTLREGLAEELIAKQVPFSLSIRYVEGGHRFSVVGYDACQKSLIILDPGGRYLSSMGEKAALKTLPRAVRWAC